VRRPDRSSRTPVPKSTKVGPLSPLPFGVRGWFKTTPQHPSRTTPTGRVSARHALDLDSPAPFGRLSAGIHPGIGAQRRSTQSNSSHVGASEANRRAMPPDGCRSEGTPSLSEGPDAWGETFGSFGAFAKGTRRKGETLSGRYRSNGYVLSQQRIGRLSGRLRRNAAQSRLAPTFGSVYIRQSQVGY